MSAHGEPARQIAEPVVADTSQSATDVIRSMALSSAELWHDVLQRLAEVQEGQVLIAQAIADLGAVVGELSAARVNTPALAAAGARGVAELGVAAVPAPGLDDDPTIAADASGDGAEDAVTDSGSAPEAPGVEATGVEAPGGEASGADDGHPQRRRRFLRRRHRPDTAAVEEDSLDVGTADADDDAPDGQAAGEGAAPDAAPDTGLVSPKPVLSLLPPAPTVLLPPPPAAMAGDLETTGDPAASEVANAAGLPEISEISVAEASAHAERSAHAEQSSRAEPSMLGDPAEALFSPAVPAPPQPIVYTPGGTRPEMDTSAAPATSEPLAVFQVSPVIMPVAAPLPAAHNGARLSGDMASGIADRVPDEAPHRLGAHDALSATGEEPSDEHLGDAVLAGVGAAVQSSASIATEILATTAHRSDAGGSAEPRPLVISEDVTLISKNRKRRHQFLSR